MAVHETATAAFSNSAGSGKEALAENDGNGGVVGIAVCTGGAADAVGACPVYVIGDVR